ncbi:MAG: Na+/H+ antiporter subunit E [Bacteroidales bacterium]|nr:Na+/H+ antiporter subunit E [Bacteroidales bacterium]
MRIKNTLVLFTVLLILWILFNNTFNLLVIGIGAALSLLFAILFCSNYMIFSEINLSPKSFFYTFIYLIIFIKEMVVSNLDMALRVLRPSLPINPGIVKVRTTLKSPMVRLFLSIFLVKINMSPASVTSKLK